MVREFVIDLFCGAGGTSEGIHSSNTSAKVIFCVNHDKNAILSHKKNHPYAKHMQEDIRNPEVIFFLKLRIKALRKLYPGCIITVWASLECINFSRAKGGLPKDADSRTLAEFLLSMDVHFKIVNGRAKKVKKGAVEENDTIVVVKSDGYIPAIDPDYVMIENVQEFMSWGPLDENGKPISKLAGTDYLRWVEEIQCRGYTYEYRILNAADFGAHTMRKRYFSQFALEGLPIVWPSPTHCKKGENNLKKWNAVRPKLELQDTGTSIFGRKKELADKTKERIYAGLQKFVPDALDHNSLVAVNYLQSYYGNGGAHSVEEPCPTIPTNDRFGLLNVTFIDQQYGQSKPTDIDTPLGTITGVPKFALVAVQHIFNPQYGSKGHAIDDPSPTIIARQDKSPLGLVSHIVGNNILGIKPEDSEITVKIKNAMREYGLADIKMRMLKVQELKEIQGFPKDYELVGTQTEQKKYIGNSVEVTVASAIFKTHNKAIQYERGNI